MPSKTEAMRDKSAFAFVPGIGYVSVGQLPLPARPVGPASDCEPPVGVANESWHMLQPPMAAPLKRMQWFVNTKEWMPMMLGAGKRLGFSSIYLAAHGWTYSRASTVEDLLS